MSGRSERIILTTMRDEGPYVLEWLAFHIIIGFDHAIVYTNDCWDLTDEILQTVAKHFGIASQYDNSDLGYGEQEHSDPQRRAYFRAHRLSRIREADLVFVIDADEFLNIHTGDGHLKDLIAAVPPFEAMSLTWELFGSNGILKLEDKPVLSQFTRRHDASKGQEDRRLGVKTLFRPQRVDKIGVHRPFHDVRIKDGFHPIRWLNGSGVDCYEHYRALKWHATAQVAGSALAQINHYPIKSSEAFLVKARRGAANSHDLERINLEYRRFYNKNVIEDRTIQRHVPAVIDLVNSWMETVPELASLHRDAVAIHKEIAAEMKKILSDTSPASLVELGFE